LGDDSFDNPACDYHLFSKCPWLESPLEGKEPTNGYDFMENQSEAFKK